MVSYDLVIHHLLHHYFLYWLQHFPVTTVIRSLNKMFFERIVRSFTNHYIICNKEYFSNDVRKIRDKA